VETLALFAKKKMLSTIEAGGWLMIIIVRVEKAISMCFLGNTYSVKSLPTALINILS
jgi:hypothetical protein